VSRLLLALLGFYRRAVSPLLGPRCRFAPSCSAYAVQAVTSHGAARGSWLTLRRLLRCQPFHPGGHDPVPLVRPTGTTMDPHATTEKSEPTRV
jgi:putative membrane protein insertion efficiency factor